ncbi:MAG TPA: PAS domain S-box protein [Bacteroidales bacterium]|nr:PAS domain S-box protein [Bacteroidales bacterium]
MDRHDYGAIYDILLKNSSTCSLMVDLNGKIILFNDAYANLIGYTVEEIKQHDFRVYISDSAYDREIGFINQLTQGEKSDIKFRSSRVAKGGRVLQVDVTAILFRDADNQPEFVLKRIEDVTSTIQSEEIHKNQLHYLQTMLEQIPLSIYFKDKQSRFITNSLTHIKMLGGESFEDVSGKTDFDFFDPIHAQQAFDDEQYIMATGKTISKEESMTLKNGSIRWGQTIKTILRDTNGEVTGTYGITSDITEIKLAEEKLNQLNEQLSAKNKELESTLEELSNTQNKLIFSEKMAALGNLIGGIAHEINTPLGAIKASSTNINDVVEKINVDLPWLINHASTDEINWLFNLINDSDARDISVFSKDERQKKRDLTALLEKNNIENAISIADTIVTLRLNKTDEEYLEFLSLPNAQILLQMLKVLFSLKRNANNIYISVEKASHVVRALKNYIHKNNSGTKESANLVETIETVLILTANMLKNNKIEVITQFEKVPLLFCRQDEICQVWTNLITNAVQAMDQGGTLEIGIKSKDDEHILVWFKDSGSGICPETAKHIFEPYFTTKETGIGTGMGLDISRQIVENHHGRIYFETTTDQGTTFFVEIPLNQDQKLPN